MVLCGNMLVNMAPILELRDLVKALPGPAGGRRRLARDSPRQFLLAAGPVGLRQDHHAAPDRRLRTTHLRRRPAQRRNRQPPQALRAQRQHRLPELRPVSAPHRAAECRVRPQAPQARQRYRPRACAKPSNWSASPARKSRRPAQLSGGERQRVALARSLVLQPDVLLLDEPLAALDPKLRKQMRLELKAMQRRVGITFLLVTHDQEEALSMSDQLAVMNEGRDRAGGHARGRLPAPAHRASSPASWAPSTGSTARAFGPKSMRVCRPASRTADRWRAGDRSPASVFLGDCVQVLVRLDSGEDAVAQAAARRRRLSARRCRSDLLEAPPTR